MSKLKGRPTKDPNKDYLPVIKQTPQTDILKRINKATKNKEIFLELITPAKANDCLIVNVKNNRPISINKLKKYVTQYVEDRWVYNGDPMRFDVDGNMVDGQKRAYASIISGKSFWAPIVTGLPRNAFSSMDQGQNRQASDVLHIDGFAHSKNLSSAIRAVMMFRRTKMLSWNSKKQESIDNVAFHEWPRHNDIKRMEFGVKEAMNKWYMKENFLGVSQWAFLYYELSDRSRTKGLEFIERLASGANMSETKDSPLYFLRMELKRIARTYNNKKRGAEETMTIREAFTKKVKTTFLAWAFWLDEAKIELSDLKLSKNELETLEIKPPKRP